ncbi:hypothetical protein JCM30471_09100 [Desulfuromonas carbonis]|uniref:peptidylprolyl isomerase n=1 Tax=Desulfuromonas sp. DDH964 TaxID=1823759 RepID=UPI00078BF684|nr:peptidylprolyl isomerase [Desulfuromonas sp. DDH964]AMV72395.1 PpiC-type peptidylprolyl cis-trans isomerase [Desulfuromonas sp. DDH964]
MPDIIARVNGQPLTRNDLDNAIQGYALQHYRKSMDQLSAEQLRQATELALEQLLARQLLFLQALAGGIVAPVPAIEAEQERLCANFPSAKEFFATLAKAGISPADHFRMLRQDLTVNLFCERQLAELAPPTATELERAWNEQGPRLQMPLKIRAAHLLIRDPGGQSAPARQKCAALAAEATPENFAALARQHSACPSAASGGDLGWVRRGTMAPEFEDLAFDLPAGAIGGPVATQFGWHLVLVLERQEARPLSREEALPQLRQKLHEERRNQALQALVRDLIAAADIRLFDATLPWPSSLSSPG